MKKYEVIIIGGGIAGLGAAMQAKKQGLSYVVLEAQNRAGGRIHSHTFKNKLVVEFGAEWISRSDATLLALCKELNIPLETHRFPCPKFVYKNGKACPEFDELFETYEQTVRKESSTKISPSLSLYEYLKKDFSEEELYKLNIVLNTDFAQHIRYVSARFALNDIAAGGNNDHMDYHVKGGNEKIISKLATFVGKKNIKLADPVDSVTTERDTVIITTKEKQEYRGSHVIMTTATQALKHLTFKPNLPEHKALARSLTYGDITKCFLVFEYPLPKKHQSFSMFTNGPMQYVYVATNIQSTKRFALCIYSVGKRARAVMKMSQDQVWRSLKRVLPPEIFDTNTIKPSEMIRKHWGSDRHTHGAYAVFQPEEYQAIQKVFSGSVPRIHFAGEYLGTNGMAGYMNGALKTGIEAIKDLPS